MSVCARARVYGCVCACACVCACECSRVCVLRAVRRFERNVVLPPAHTSHWRGSRLGCFMRRCGRGGCATHLGIFSALVRKQSDSIRVLAVAHLLHIRRGSPLCVKTDLDPEGQFVRRTAVYTAIERPSPPHTRTPAAVSSAASARLACREYQEHPPHAPLPARRLLAAARTPKVAMPVGLQPAVRRSERLPPEALPSAVSPLCSPRRERRDRCPSAARLPRTRPSPCACAT